EDEEDVALSAFASFCRGVEAGRFPRLDDRDGLWRVLFTLTVRKAHRLARDEGRLKRGGGAAAGTEDGLARMPDGEPTPALAAEMADGFDRLLGLLGDAELRSIAVGKMDGDTNAELAARLGCAPSTVERRLALIRQLWEKELDAVSAGGPAPPSGR
ncbi:MAG: ECF-type sigma factor, partial [Gemmataceae bacterium]